MFPFRKHIKTITIRDLARAHISTYQPDKRYEVVNLRIEIPLKTSWSFDLMPEGYLVHFFKTFKLVIEIQVGDSEWDRQMYIVGDAQGISNLFSAFPELRKSTLITVKNGFKIRVTSTAVIFEKTQMSKDDTDNEIAAIEKEIEVIVLSLIEAEKTEIKPGTDYNKIAFQVLITFVVTTFLLLIYVSALTTEENVFHLGGNVSFYGFVSGLIFGFLLLVLWRIVRKLHSRSHYEFLLLSILLPFGFAVAGSSSAFFLNRVLDYNSGYIQNAEVSKKTATRVKHGIVYRIVYKFPVPLEIRPRPTISHFEEIVGHEEYFFTGVGDKKMIRVYPGFYGQPWVAKSFKSYSHQK